jgi:hypothetical protein
MVVLNQRAWLWIKIKFKAFVFYGKIFPYNAQKNLHVTYRLGVVRLSTTVWAWVPEVRLTKPLQRYFRNVYPAVPKKPVCRKIFIV